MKRCLYRRYENGELVGNVVELVRRDKTNQTVTVRVLRGMFAAPPGGEYCELPEDVFALDWVLIN